MSGQDTIYQMITDKIIDLLEKGVVPWRKPWTGGSNRYPLNLTNKKQYRGINIFLLHASGYDSPYWLSYKQAQEKGGSVRKGEKGTPVIFWKLYDTEDKKTGEMKKVPVLRYFTVFNLRQCEGLLDPDPPVIVNAEFNPIDEASRIVACMPKRPAIIHEMQRAFYRPSEDTVNMPKPETFERREEYYSTLFHELTHSTGHESRLNRRNSSEIRHFGDPDYSKEELVAEMGAAYLCGASGIENTTIDNSASYIASWLKALRNDHKLLVHAGAQAQKAADFILGVKAKSEEGE